MRGDFCYSAGRAFRSFRGVRARENGVPTKSGGGTSRRMRKKIDNWRARDGGKIIDSSGSALNTGRGVYGLSSVRRDALSPVLIRKRFAVGVGEINGSREGNRFRGFPFQIEGVAIIAVQKHGCCVFMLSCLSQVVYRYADLWDH